MILIGIVTAPDETEPAQAIDVLESEIAQRGLTGFGANFLHLTQHGTDARLTVINSAVSMAVHGAKPSAHALIVSNIKTDLEAAALRKYGATIWHTTPITDVPFLTSHDLWVGTSRFDSYEPVEALIETRLIQGRKFSQRKKSAPHE